jgi:hypothetical protein
MCISHHPCKLLTALLVQVKACTCETGRNFINFPIFAATTGHQVRVSLFYGHSAAQFIGD